MMFCADSTTSSFAADPNRADSTPGTVNAKLREVWNSQPEREAMVFYDDDDERTSLKNFEVFDLAERGASLLHSHGVNRGDVVCNMLPNSMEREVMNFAILLAGAVVLHGDGIDDNTKNFWIPLKQAEVKYVIVDTSISSPQWHWFEPLVGKSDAYIERVTSFEQLPTLQKVFKFALDHDLKNVNRAEFKTTFDILRTHSGVFIERVNSHEPASIVLDLCTSQKHYRMVMRTHSEICQIANRVEDMLHTTCHDIIFNDIPLAWIAGLPFNYIASGCTMVRSTLCYCPLAKVVRQTWHVIETEKCTMAAILPPMIQMLAAHCEDIPQPKWQLRAITTLGLVRQSIMDAIGSCTESVIICYSLIEAGLVSRLIVTEENKARYSEGCVGDLSDPVRTKYEKGAKATQIGEVLLQGKLVCREYYRDPLLTRVSFTKEGFLLTGDLGFTSETSASTPPQLFVLGRKADAIIRGNTAIFPREIEEKVNQCPGIWKVKVVSIKDDNGVVQMCACVIPRSQDALTIDRVKEFCRYQLGGTLDDDHNPHMPTYVFFFDDFPTRHGRVNRRLLAYMASEIVHKDTKFEQ